MREETAREFLKMSPEELEAFLDRVRRYAGPDDYRKIEEMAQFLLCLRERLAAGDATLAELLQFIQDSLQTIPGSSMEPERPCPR